MPLAENRTPIRGISKTALWRSWKNIRQELKNSSIRDIIDFLDYDVDPDIWIRGLLLQLRTGRYEPTTPQRFTLAKSNGFSRTMTLPSIPDLTLYRTIVDFIYSKVRYREHKHVYFRRSFLDQAQREAQLEAEAVVQTAGQYGKSGKAYLNWLKYNQYRKHLLLERIFPFLVTTDISNFFDSLLHSHVQEALRGVRIPPRMIGLLFFLLERLSIRQDYSGSHDISLPVDEFDCSRTLAHLVLFSHDTDIVAMTGEGAYVRWMDDQNMGVESKAKGLKTLAEVGRSLARLHLAPNTKKSRILSLSEARRHFHLDLNSALDRCEQIWKQSTSQKSKSLLRRHIRAVWSRALAHEGVGEFEKILKRIYLFAGRAGARFLRRRAVRDILSQPGTAQRICDYMRNSGSVLEYLNFVEQLLNSEEQIYEDVNIILIESLLRLEASGFEVRRIRSLASQLLKGDLKIAGQSHCRAIAPLLLLRFADRRSLSLLRNVLSANRRELTFPLSRAVAFALASYGPQEFQLVRRAASKLLNNHLSTVVLLIERIREYEKIPERYQNRLKTRFDSIKSTQYLDMRSILTARLLLLNRRPAVREWIEKWKNKILIDKSLPKYDRTLLQRMVTF